MKTTEPTIKVSERTADLIQLKQKFENLWDDIYETMKKYDPAATEYAGGSFDRQFVPSLLALAELLDDEIIGSIRDNMGERGFSEI